MTLIHKQYVLWKKWSRVKGVGIVAVVNRVLRAGGMVRIIVEGVTCMAV